MGDFRSFLEARLNKQQLEAALSTNENSLILAGAGSGKTRTLTYKIANLVYGEGAAGNRILAVTFTNKAAREMKERLEEIIEEYTSDDHQEQTSNNVLDFDQLISGENEKTKPQLRQNVSSSLQRVGTFHSIFLKILKHDLDKLGNGYSKQFVIYDVSDTKKLVNQVIAKLKFKDIVDAKQVKGQISLRKNAGYLPKQAALHCSTQQEERIVQVYTEYQKQLRSSNALDFDDLLLLPKILFDEYPEVLEKWKKSFDYILVDEAQDTNEIQFQIMKMLCRKDSYITFIGDDYQSIYRRRGAVMQNFLNLQKRRPDIKTFKLETNYRSLPHIVEAGNAIIGNNKQQYSKDISAHRTGDEHIRLLSFSGDREEASQVIELITKIKEENEKPRNDFTILYRTNAQSVPFEQVLISEGIPYKILGAFKFFERSEVKDILGYCKVLINSNDNLTLTRIINTPSRKIGKTSIQQIQSIADQEGVPIIMILRTMNQYASSIKPALQTKLISFGNCLADLRNKAEEMNPGELIEYMTEVLKYEERLIKQDGKDKAQERMGNIGQLINLAMKRQQPGVESLSEFLEEISLLTSIEESQKEEADCIKLMSVHGSKGLEFPYVFLVGVEENIFPLPNAKFDDAELEEERRGMYVAITRAKDHLFISHALSRLQRGQLKYNSPSRFIKEIPDNLIKAYDLTGTNSSGNSFYQGSSPSFEPGDKVAHKLFGTGRVLEMREKVCIVQFDNPKFGTRKLEARYLKG